MNSRSPVIFSGVSVVSIFHLVYKHCCNVYTNSADRDQRQHLALSDLGLHCLSFPAGPRSAVGWAIINQRSWVRYPVWPHTFVSPSADSRGAVVSYWRKYVHEVLVNRLGGLSLPRKSMVRLTDRPDMT